MKFTRPKLHSDVRYAHAEVLLSLINQVLEMPSSADGSETSVGSGSCLNQELLPLNLKARLSSYHWTRAAGACFASSLVRRCLIEFAPLRQLHRWVALCVRTGSGPGSPRGQPAWGGGCDRIISST